MAPVNRLVQLSDIVSQKAKVITDFLASKGVEVPSFDVDGVAEYPITPNDTEAFDARLELIAASKELYALAHGPKDHIRNLCWDALDPLSLQALWTFRVAEAVPLDGLISYEQVTRKCQELSGVDVPLFNLQRLIRHAITNRFFCEPNLGFITHTRASRLLLEDETINAWVGLFSNDMWPAFASTVTAMKTWPGSEEANETGVNIAYRHNLRWFDHTSRNPLVADRYSKSMKAHGGGVGFDVSHTVTGYPWSQIGDGLVVDADIYFFRWVFHGFADKYAVQVLRAMIPVLKEGARIVINDGVIPDPGTVPWMEYRSIRCMDLLGQAVNNTGERSVGDWANLFKKTDPRFKWLNAWKPPKSTMWFVEAEWQP
ncbi:hypothetical protein BDW62DRAFT_219692 [Aspergillus aurantiobrunneus]